MWVLRCRRICGSPAAANLALNQTRFITRKTRFQLPTPRVPTRAVEPKPIPNSDGSTTQQTPPTSTPATIPLTPTTLRTQDVETTLAPPPAISTPFPRLKTKGIANAETFDVGDAVYAVENFKQMLNKQVMKEIVPDDVRARLEQGGHAAHVDIPGFDYDSFKDAFNEALLEYHETEGSARIKSEAEQIQQQLKQQQQQQQQQQKQSKTKAEDQPARQKVVNADPVTPLDHLSLDRALTRARDYRKRSRTHEKTAMASFDESEKTLRDEFALGPRELRTHIVHLGSRRSTGFDDDEDYGLRKKRPKTVGLTVRQKQTAARILEFLDGLHSNGDLFRSDILNYGIEFSNVTMTRDLRKAIVNWTYSDEQVQRRVSVVEITGLLAPYVSRLRVMLARRVNMKYTPELLFEQDTELDRELEIAVIMDAIAEETRELEARDANEIQQQSDDDDYSSLLALPKPKKKLLGATTKRKLLSAKRKQKDASGTIATTATTADNNNSDVVVTKSKKKSKKSKKVDTSIGTPKTRPETE